MPGTKEYTKHLFLVIGMAQLMDMHDCDYLCDSIKKAKPSQLGAAISIIKDFFATMNKLNQLQIYLAQPAPKPEPVGFAIVFKMDGRDLCYLFYIEIDEGERGKGIGSKFLQYIIKKHPTIGLKCTTERVGFYCRNGFTIKILPEYKAPGAELACNIGSGLPYMINNKTAEVPLFRLPDTLIQSVHKALNAPHVEAGYDHDIGELFASRNYL